MFSYIDEIVGERIYVCDDGCNATKRAEWTAKQCEENITKECMFVFHNEHCICNKENI
jgi:hypothetical protein